MAFYLTSEISIGDNVNVKANKVTWKSDVGTFIDTCTITLPRISYLKNDVSDKTFEKKPIKKYSINEGDKVSVSLGYNKRNNKRFIGFVKRVNMGIPVEIECEGYGYQLYDIIFNKTYAQVTVKDLLNDVIQGTDIVLSSEIPDIPLKNVRFKNATGIQVLEWLKNECKLAVYFNMNEIYAGTLFGKVQSRAKAIIGRNVISDSDFKKKKVDKNVKIVIREKNDQGDVKKTKSDQQKYSDEKSIKIKAGIPAQFLKQIAERLQTKENYKGYEGGLTLFLEPYVTKGMVLEVVDNVYEEKTGNFFIEEISGEFSASGGRQNVKLGFLMDGNKATN